MACFGTVLVDGHTYTGQKMEGTSTASTSTALASDFKTVKTKIQLTQCIIHSPVLPASHKLIRSSLFFLFFLALSGQDRRGGFRSIGVSWLDRVALVVAECPGIPVVTIQARAT
jgi:hypothetical protein